MGASVRHLGAKPHDCFTCPQARVAARDRARAHGRRGRGDPLYRREVLSGADLVARSGKGICAILLGDSSAAGVRDPGCLSCESKARSEPGSLGTALHSRRVTFCHRRDAWRVSAAVEAGAPFATRNTR